MRWIVRLLDIDLWHMAERAEEPPVVESHRLHDLASSDGERERIRVFVLADRFGVSLPTACYRLHDLGSLTCPEREGFLEKHGQGQTTELACSLGLEELELVPEEEVSLLTPEGRGG